MTTEIVFEMHSLSTENEPGIATGWLEGRLSEKAGGSHGASARDGGGRARANEAGRQAVSRRRELPADGRADALLLRRLRR